MARWKRYLLHVGAGIAAAAVLVALLALLLLRTGPGRSVVARAVAALSGGQVRIAGLSGALPNHLHTDSLEIADAQGVWLKAWDVTLDWRALGALGNHADIARLDAARIAVLRRPASEKAEGADWTIDIAHFAVARLDVAKAAVGHAGVIAASGSLHYVSLRELAADIDAQRLDRDGRYRANLTVWDGNVRGTVGVSESGDGLLGGALGLPDLGPVSLQAHAADGNQFTLSLRAGALSAEAHGTFDSKKRTADAAFAVSSAAMQPRKDFGWSALSAKGRLTGSLDKPHIAADLTLAKLKAAGASADNVQAVARGANGTVDLDATATGLVASGMRMLANAPVKATARLVLDEPTRPVTFTLAHPLLTLQGKASTLGPFEGEAIAGVASLAAFGAPVDGRAALRLQAKDRSGALAASLEGTLVARGDTTLARLIGARAQLDAETVLRDGKPVTARGTLQGAAATLRVTGTGGAAWSYRWQAALANVALLAPNLRGRVDLGGTLSGPEDALRLTGTGTALLGVKSAPPQSLRIALEANGLPRLAQGRISVTGSFDNAGLTALSRVARERDGLMVTLERATWKSLTADGHVAFAGKPHGTLALKIANLADLSDVLGTKLAGAASVDAQGPLDALAVKLTATGAVGATHLRAVADARVNTSAHKAVVTALHGSVQDKDVALLAPATLDWTRGVSVDRLRARFDKAEITLSGKVAPELALTVAVEGVTTDTLAPWVQTERWDGVVSGEAKVTGTPDKPVATFTLHGEGLRPPGLSRSLPSGALVASGRLRDRVVTLDARLTGGNSLALAANGEVPLAQGKSIAVRLEGDADLAIVSPLIAASGRTVTGKLSVHGRVTGALAAPRAFGTVALTGGEVQDYARGIRLRAMTAEAQAEGNLIRLTRFEARAGHGTVSGSGRIDLASPGTPLDLHFAAKGARPLTSDRLTATVDADLALTGTVRQAKLSGTIRILQGNIVVPDRYPPNVAVLDVRRKGETPPPPRDAGSAVALDLTVDSAGRLFVRGRGLDAELGGRFTLAGTSDAPLVIGALEMRRGTFSVAGRTLEFRSGKVSFDGNGLRNRLDPTLDFTAVSESGGITATLNVGGYASAPTIRLSSAPSLPQDEVIARMLFQQSVKSLSPLQLAEIAQVLASLGGIGSGFDPVGSLRKSLGLDRLSVGGSTSGNSATVEAGKYVLRNVYVGAKQDLSGGTRAVVEVDLTRNLKAQATVSTGAAAVANPPGSTPADTGDSVGLSYQFEY
ncbi:MAG TPA: translocation/assembly module TamB domain-containing protein [Rhizomicrobium sp.]|nr:translocation/assembly module TamB domain-containing protein [Rhizomicrobium sp.]